MSTGFVTASRSIIVFRCILVSVCSLRYKIFGLFIYVARSCPSGTKLCVHVMEDCELSADVGVQMYLFQKLLTELE